MLMSNSREYDLEFSGHVLCEQGKPQHLLCDSDVLRGLEFKHGKGVRGELANKGKRKAEVFRRLMEEFSQVCRPNCLSGIDAEGRGERLRVPALTEREDTNFLTVMNALENVLLIGQPEEAIDLARRKKNLTKLLAAEVTIYAAGGNDAATAAGAKQVVALLDE